MSRYKYITYCEGGRGCIDYPIIEEFSTKKEADRFIRQYPDKTWHIDRIRESYWYCVHFDYSHVHSYEPRHECVLAGNAKEACKIVLEKYYDNLAWWAENKRTRSKPYYPFHLRARRIEE